MEFISAWATPAIVISVAGLFWRYLVRLEQRFDRRFDRMEQRMDTVAGEVSANGRAIARLEGLHSGHPVHAAE